jgi:AcrR family transcriptional regulator
MAKAEGAHGQKVSTRKIKVLGAESSTTRAALLAAAEDLLREEGYAAVTSRAIAERAGLKHQVIFYYFDTLDDLLLEVFRRVAEKGQARVAEAAAAERPLTALWELLSERRGAKFTVEFMALAMHNPVIREELARATTRLSRLQTKGVEQHFERNGTEPPLPPELISLVLTAVAGMLANQTILGVRTSHAETDAIVRSILKQLEPPAPARAKPRRKTKG